MNNLSIIEEPLIKEGGLRLGDHVHLHPLYGNKKSITLNRPVINFISHNNLYIKAQGANIFLPSWREEISMRK